MKIRYLNDISLYILTFDIIDNDPDECVTYVNILNNDDNLIQLDYINNRKIIVNINILPNQEIARLCKLKLHIVNNNGEESIYNELWYITRNIELSMNNTKNYILKEDLIYRDILLTTFYNKAYRDLFLELDTLDEIENLVYQPDTTSYTGSNGSYLIQSILSNDTNQYRDFLVHVETENDNYKIEYSLDNKNTWIEINSDEDIHVDEDIVNLDIRISFTGDNTIYSFGVIYDKNE